MGVKPKKKAAGAGKAPPRKKVAATAAAEPSESPEGSAAPRGTDLSTKISASASVVLAIVLAVVVNILGARHYKRWDFTRGGQFTLSDATVQTLERLDREVTIIVLLSKDDPMGVTVDEMLEAYTAKTDKLRIDHVDPDRDRGKLLEVQKKYGVLAGERGGRVVTDSALILVAGDRHHYVSGDELVKVEDPEDMRAKPRLEHAITGGIRAVVAREREAICFTTGHGEPEIDAAGAGFAELKHRLAKENFDVRPVFGPDPVAASLEGCRLLVLAGPRSPVPPDHVAQMKAFIEGGGDALLVVGPVANVEQTDWVHLGVDDLVALAGVTVLRDIVYEGDAAMRPSRGLGEAFFPRADPHPITTRLIREADRGISPLVYQASTIGDKGTELKPDILLRTSDKAVGFVDYWQRLGTHVLKAGPDDHPGPLTIATATVRPPKEGQARGARVVVIGTMSPLLGVTWSDPDQIGTALFMEGVFTWLTEHEAFLDIPDKPAVTTSLKLTEDSLTSIFRYVMILVPLVVLVSGLVILYGRRRRAAAEKEEPA